MTILRYTASADNTITNAYTEGLKLRGTGSNMGASDILEVFSIYGQQSETSSELSRILIQFPVDKIKTDRDNGKIPASGRVDFYLKMYNARHMETVPRNFNLAILPISASWQEGYGLDMEQYSDLTNDNSGS